MARWYQPQKRQSDGRWDMTVSSDEEGWAHAIGYCAGWRGDPDEAEKKRLTDLFGDGFVERLAKEHDALRPHQDKFHRDGHATSEEASACWDRYPLDCELAFHESTSEQHKCQACGAWTPKYAELGREMPQRYHLCDAHCNRETVERLENDRRETYRKHVGRNG